MKIKERQLKSIPTVYNGVQLKSRMESKVALLLDKLGWTWEYEPFSVMLDGINYTPDFYVRERGYVIECRGYESDLGKKQIARFGNRVYGAGIDIPGCRIGNYAVLGPDRVVCPTRGKRSWPELTKESNFVAAMHRTGTWEWLPGRTMDDILSCDGLKASSLAVVEVNVSKGEILLDLLLIDKSFENSVVGERNSVIQWAKAVSCESWGSLPFTKDGAEAAIMCYRCAVASKVAEEAGYDGIADAFFHAKRTTQWSDVNHTYGWKICLSILTDELINRVISSIAFLSGISENELEVLPPETSEDGVSL